MAAGDFNVFAVDWGNIAYGPCYPAAVWNAKLAGKCSALLVERIRELNVTDIHVIGFSLGKADVNNQQHFQIFTLLFTQNRVSEL